jgi:hypothetical protein
MRISGGGRGDQFRGGVEKVEKEEKGSRRTRKERMGYGRRDRKGQRSSTRLESNVK